MDFQASAAFIERHSLRSALTPDEITIRQRTITDNKLKIYGS